MRGIPTDPGSRTDFGEWRHILKEEKHMKKYVAEFIGTLTLVLIGCGTAMLVGCNPGAGSGYILTAFAFGLVIVAMVYSIGNISDCHINPAVSLALLLSGRMEKKDFVPYVIAQCAGALAGSAPIASLVVFIVGPMLGAAAAAFLYKYLES